MLNRVNGTHVQVERVIEEKTASAAELEDSTIRCFDNETWREWHTSAERRRWLYWNDQRNATARNVALVDFVTRLAAEKRSK